MQWGYWISGRSRYASFTDVELDDWHRRAAGVGPVVVRTMSAGCRDAFARQGSGGQTQRALAVVEANKRKLPPGRLSQPWIVREDYLRRFLDALALDESVATLCRVTEVAGLGGPQTPPTVTVVSKRAAARAKLTGDLELNIPRVVPEGWSPRKKAAVAIGVGVVLVGVVALVAR